MSGYGPDVTVTVPPELGLGDADREHFDWYRYDRPRSLVSPVQAAKTVPELIAVEPIDTKLFACSGGIESRSYREATTYRRSHDLTWEEARVALRRLYLPVQYAGSAKPADFVGLAEFALTADGYQGFVGRKGDHAGKLRDELDLAYGGLRDHLARRLDMAEHHAARLAQAITRHGADMTDPAVASRLVGAFSTLLPLAGAKWVQLARAAPDEVLAALEELRSRWVTWSVRRPAVDDVIARLQAADRRPRRAMLRRCTLPRCCALSARS